MRKLKLLIAAALTMGAAVTAGAADFTDGGKYYLKNTASGKYWGAGNGWGTTASLVEHPEYVYLHLQNDGQYTIESQVSNGGDNKYFNGEYMDNNNAWWLTFTQNDEGKYTIAASGTNYFGYDGTTTVLGKNLDGTSANALWEVYSEAEMRTQLEAATVDAPVDATWLMLDPNFGRNNVNVGKWTMVANNQNLSGGNNTNNCAESWHSTFTLSQALTSVPNGTYRMTAQGFYRQDGSDNDNLPYFYANDEKQTFGPMGTLPDHSGNGQNGMDDASVEFSNGNYTIEPIWVRVTDGNLTVGAKNETNTALWCIWDNFVLTYYGDVTIVEAKLAAFVSDYNEALAAAKAYQSTDMFDEDKTALNTAINDNTLDLTGDVTEGQLTTATSNLNAAAAAAATAALKYTTYTNAQTLINGGENVDLTSVIVNPSFEQGTNGWTVEGGLGPQSNTSFGKTGTYYLEYWQPNGTKSVKQTVGYLPAGLYKMTVRVKARGVTSAKVFAGGIDKAVTVEDAENEYTVDFALDEKTDAVIGFEGVGTGAGSSWFAMDNFRLTFVGGLPDELTAVTGKMNSEVAAAQTTAIETYVSTKSVANYNAAAAAIAAAQASVDAYAAAAAAIAKANGILAETNVYTADSKTAYKEAISAAQTAYDGGTMTDADAAALENTLNGGTAYKPTALMRDFYASAWTATNGVSIYTNNWSTEGNTDGSNFSTPFIEDWVSDANSLANTTISASVAGLATGTYKVTAKVRLRLKNNGSAPVSGVSMQATGGEAVAISGETNYGSFYVADVEATGYVVTEGENLTISFSVNGTNASWLSIKAVNYERTGDVALADADDYTALNAAMEGKTLGFEAGEYAPYNNIAAVEALAAAKAIDQTAENSKPAVTAATAALNAATWTANTEEVNAIYDGSFNLTTETDGTYILPIGWTNLGYNTRVYNSTNMGDNAGVNATSQKACMFAKFTTEYGTKAGYTMPLKAGEYVLEFIYGGWNEVATRDIKIYCGDTQATVNPVTVTAKNNQAHVSTDAWSSYKGLVTIPADGDYVLSFYRQSTTAQNQICVSDIVLKKAPVYAVVGNASFFSGSWDQTTTTDMLTLTDGVFTKTYTDLTLDKQTIAYKFIKKATADAEKADVWYDNNTNENQTINIPVKGKYDITFTFDETTVAGVAVKNAEAVVIGEKGWATTVTNSPLDFSQETAFRAYTATVSDDNVTLAQVANVKAETGLVLHGDEGTYYLPVIESSETDKGSLMFSSTETYNTWQPTDGTVNTFYGLTVNSDNKAQFVKLNDGTIPAQKAFLMVNTPGSGARELKVVFAGETTGIDSIAAETVAAEGVYNLNGQRVNAPAKKGLYIVNGKKVILK